MAIQSASAKLYTGIRCWCVDKNISANLTATFTTGHLTTYNGDPLVMDLPVLSGVLARKTVRYIADLTLTPSMSITNQRLKTFGGGNNVITPGASRVIDNTNNWKVTASVVCKFPTYFRIDVDKLQLPQGTTCTVSFEEGWIKDGEYLETTRAPSAAIGNFFTFRTPWLGASFMTSTFTGLGSFLFRRRPGSMFVNSAFTPVMSAKVTRQGVTDLQSAFTAVIRAGEIVRLLSRADFFAVAGPVGPAGMPYLEGNGYPYYNFDGSLTGLGKFPAIIRIRQSTATFTQASTATLSAEVYNLPYIVPAVNYSSEFTMTANCDAFKGVGTPSLVATTAMTSSARVEYNSTVPTMQATTTVFCRTPQQANAALVAQSSVTADIGQSLELVWNAFGGDTIGIVFKGPNLSITCKWSDGVQTTISGGTINPDIGGLPTYYYTRSVPSTGYLTLRVTGSLSGFQMSRNGVDYINGEINQDDSYLGPAPTWAVAGRNQLVACNGWGDLGITDLNGAFANCGTLDTVPNFLPKNVTSTACMFLNCVNMNDSAVLTWNTSTITTMAGMFRQASQFNQPIGVWDTSSVVRMSRMFRGGNSNNYPVVLRDSSFNQSLNDWDVTGVSRGDMTEMFYFNELMAGNCNQWCVSHIATVPTNFSSSTTTRWPTANRPIWGTCP
jgi:hypothetical protein